MMSITNGIVMIWFHFFKRIPVLELISSTKQMNRSKLSIEEERIHSRYQNFHDSVTKYLLIIYVSTYLMYITTPLLAKRFPYRGYYPDAAYYYPWYPMIYIIQGLGIMFFLLIFALSFNYYCITFCCQLFCELELVKHFIMNLNPKDKSCLARVIKKHAAALDYGSRLCTCFQSTFVLMHIMMSTFTCFAGVIILTFEKSSALPNVIATTIILVSTMLVICCIGEKLTSASLEIGDAVTNHCFVVFLGDVNSLKSSSFILLRAQQPLRMKVGWKSSINLSFFSNTMNTILSALMVLKTMME